jgi:lysophospholipase L1-like esterase
MRLPVIRLSIAAMISASLIGCANTPSTPAAAAPTATAVQGAALVNVTLTGLVGAGLADTAVLVYDANGTTRTVISDKRGNYSLKADGLVAPLMLVSNNGLDQFISIVANPSGNVVANINALTDLVASDVAREAKFRGPAAMAAAGKAPAVSPETLKLKTKNLQPLIGTALKSARVTDAENFDPVSSTSAAVNDILRVIRHNRGYDSNNGERGASAIYDSTFHEITKFSPLNLQKAQAEQKAVTAPGVVRVFVAGDSTASNYDAEVFPRMGWGQAFDRQFKEGGKVRVIDVAQSGRSSRSFINEGWFDMIAADIRQGDYLLVQFGHNDEKCGNEPPAPLPARDSVDIATLCTYPGTAANIPAEMSFQKNLEKYIAIAKNAGATPVLITPVTRRSFKGGSIGGTTHTYSKGKFPGDYSQTVRDTAKTNGVTLIDLDARSIEFFNKIGEQGSLDYYLAVDVEKYPYYKTNTGRRDKPDNTHMQEKGAEAVGGLIAQGIKDAQLPLASELK